MDIERSGDDIEENVVIELIDAGKTYGRIDGQKKIDRSRRNCGRIYGYRKNNGRFDRSRNNYGKIFGYRNKCW
jgi:hypothetical protein